jgi:hypothetical protein
METRNRRGQPDKDVEAEGEQIVVQQQQQTGEQIVVQQKQQTGEQIVVQQQQQTGEQVVVQQKQQTGEQIVVQQKQQTGEQIVVQQKEQMGVEEMLRQLSQQMLLQQQAAQEKQTLQQQEAQEKLAQQFAASQLQQQTAQEKQALQQQTAQEKLAQQFAASQLQQQAALEKQTQQQLAAQEKLTQQLKSQVAATLEEHSARLESRLLGQLAQDTGRIRTEFQREVTAVNERVDGVEKGQDLQQQQLASQQQRLDRLDSAVGEHANLHKEVGEKFFSLSGRLDVVQREMYQRISTMEGGRVTESLTSTGLSRPVTPMVEGCPAKLKTRPVPFDGKTSWVGYKAQFDLISDLNGWTLTDRAQYLAASLAGPALTVLTNLSVSERLSYGHLTEALNTRFNDGRSAELARVKLDNRKQLPNERLPQYASEVESLTHLAYPSAGGEARDILTRERFLKGLVSSELRKQIKLSRAVTFAEMLGTAIELEAVLLCEGDNSDQANYRRPAVRLVQEEGGSPRQRGRGACFRCGSLEHYQAYCNADLVNCERPPPRSFNLNANSRRYTQPANAFARTRRASDSRGERDSSMNIASSALTHNSPVDVIGAIERLGKRMDALSEDRRQHDVSAGHSIGASATDRHQRAVSDGCSNDALTADRPQRAVSGDGRRSGSVPRGGAMRRGECFECG